MWHSPSLVLLLSLVWGSDHRVQRHRGRQPLKMMLGQGNDQWQHVWRSEVLSWGLLLHGKCVVIIHAWDVCKPCDVTRMWHCPTFLLVGARVEIVKNSMKTDPLLSSILHVATAAFCGQPVWSDTLLSCERHYNIIGASGLQEPEVNSFGPPMSPCRVYFPWVEVWNSEWKLGWLWG